MVSRKGISAIVAVILLLLMTIAAAGAAYLWITKLTDLISRGATDDFIRQQQKQNTRYTIDTAWNDTDDLALVVRNAGTYELAAPELDKTTVFIDGRLKTFGIETKTPAPECFYKAADLTAIGGNFPTDTVLTIHCNNTYGGPVLGTYPKMVVKVQPPFGTGDTYTYQYSP